jgi:hypothetical protein
MAKKMTYAESGAMLESINVFERLEANGTIRPDEQAWLDNYRKEQASAEDEQIKTIATYRGAVAGGTMNLADEIRGAYEAANDFIRRGDVESAKAKYAEYRDLVREKDAAAMLLAPEEFASGETSGSIMGAAIPAAGSQAVAAGKGLSMLSRLGLGAGTGAASTALPEFAGGEGGFTNRMSEVSPVSTAIGASLGAAAPAAGAIAGGTVRAAQNLRSGVEGFGSRASRRVARAMNQREALGEDIQDYLSSLGPEGVIADIPGSPQQLAQGLASIPGEGGGLLQREIIKRAAGAGERIQDTVTRRVDQPEAAFQQRRELAEERSSVLGPMYDAATASDTTFNVDAIRSGITFIGKDAASNVKKRLNETLTNLGEEGPVSAERLHNARTALSDAMFAAKIKGEGGVVANLKPILAEVDTRLDDIPNYADARVGYANNKAIERAIEEGRKAFTGGATSAMSPAVLKEALAKMSPAQRDAYKKGAREYISALMGTSTNDAAAAWRAFGKEWNAEKMALIVGDEDAAEIARRLMAEKVFSETRGKVLEGSQTSQRTEAREALADLRDQDTGRAPGPLMRLRRGIEEPVNRVIDEVLYGPRRSNLNREIGQILSLQGDARDRAVNALLEEGRKLNDPTRFQSIVDAVTTVGGLTAAPLVANDPIFAD